MLVNWIKDVDAAFAQAKAEDKPLLIDFSAAPAWGACAQLEAESFSDQEIANFINHTFVPLESHIKEHPAYFKRFEAVWTPTILVMDSQGVERYRIEGYLPKNWFRARLEMGLARVQFMHKKFADAEKIYAAIIEQHADTGVVPEAIYWRGVCHYKATNDHTVLTEVAKELAEKYPDDESTLKSVPWAHWDKQ
jgi:thioredoxin-related protein